MMKKLVDLYNSGAITADHLAVECLHMLDPANPDLVLGALPESIPTKILAYAQEYQTGRMRSNYGTLPTVDQVEAAKCWITSKRVAAGSNEVPTRCRVPHWDPDRETRSPSTDKSGRG